MAINLQTPIKNIKLTVKCCLVEKEVAACICVRDDDVSFEVYV